MSPIGTKPSFREGQGLLRLDPRDNVFTATAEIELHSVVVLGESHVQVAQRIPIGHKLAARKISTGEKVIKYGVSIGSASCEIQAGEHVHTHNLTSDYLPTYTHDRRNSFLDRQP